MRAGASQLKKSVIDLYWSFRGPCIRVPPLPPDPQSVLFVCKGNICRSPFAEHLATRLGKERSLGRIKFGSAGLHVRAPVPPPEMAVQVARQFGVDLEQHRSQPITPTLVEFYDMIVAMEMWQYDELRSSFPRLRQKMFLLPLLDHDGFGREKGYAAFNIRDPYGGSLSLYKECFDRIERAIKMMLTKLVLRA